MAYVHRFNNEAMQVDNYANQAMLPETLLGLMKEA